MSRLRVVGDETDLFGGENSGYDVENFYTNARDGAGNSETKYLKIAGNILGQIGMLVSSKQIPQYKTEADFIRDAVYHRLKFVAEKIKNGDMDDVVNWSVRLDRTLAHQAEMQQMLQVIATHEETMAAAVNGEDIPMLQELIANAEGDLEDLRDTYKQKLTVVILKNKGELRKLKEKK